MHDVVEDAYPFRQTTRDRLNDAINRLVLLYAKCITRGDVQAAARQLRVFQREHIAWERDTVWRTMISQERRGEHDGQVKALGGHAVEEESASLAVPTPIGKLRVTAKMLFLAIAVLVFAILLNVRTYPTTEANNCFAILVFSTILWATEVRSRRGYYYFSYMFLLGNSIVRDVHACSIPSCHFPGLHLVGWKGNTFGGTRSDEVRYVTRFVLSFNVLHVTRFVFSQMFSPTIMLLIGGFTIASALSKTNIDRVIITRLLSLAGTKPHVVLLAFMGVSCFASMWIRWVQFSCRLAFIYSTAFPKKCKFN